MTFIQWQVLSKLYGYQIFGTSTSIPHHYAMCGEQEWKGFWRAPNSWCLFTPTGGAHHQ